MTIDLVVIETSNKTAFDKMLQQLCFKSIEKNLPWINNIYYVFFEPNLPNINITKKINYIYATNLVEEENIPNISAENIGLFLHNIPRLSEKFLIMYEDTYIINTLSKDTFFQNELPVLTYVPTSTKDNSVLFRTCCNAAKLCQPNLKATFNRIAYGITPCSQEILNLVWMLREDLLTKNLKNIHWTIIYYIIKLKQEAKPQLMESVFNYSTAWAGLIKYDLLNNPKRSTISITNKFLEIEGLQSIKLHPTAEKWILEGLEYRLK